ncbi:MAG: KH domain-containing protein [bacterium]|nr:KH domain-containing protein [bacterium]
MKDLLEFLARELVDFPDQVEVKEIEGERCVILELRVSPEDMGKVIGRRGKTAQAIRTLVKAAGLRDGKKVMIEII